MNEKRILVAFDGSENALRAVDYVGKVLGAAPGFQVRLLYVERVPERDFFATEAAWKEACEAQAAGVRQALAKAEAALKAAGLPEGSVGSEYLPSCRSPQNQAPACVSKAEEFLFGSVSTKVMHLAKDCAVWVVA